jgi:hypothetical protein
VVAVRDATEDEILSARAELAVQPPPSGDLS